MFQTYRDIDIYSNWLSLAKGQTGRKGNVKNCDMLTFEKFGGVYLKI